MFKESIITRESNPSVWWGIGGFLWGLVIALGSVAAAGGGHGWVSALPFGFLAIFASPLTFIAWARRKTNGRALAIIAITVAVLADISLVFSTSIEGMEFFYEVLPIALFWIPAWASWQVFAGVVLVCSYKRQTDGGTKSILDDD